MTTNNQLSPGQVDQLVKALVTSNSVCAPMHSYEALRGGPKFSDEQQQKLVDTIAKDTLWASRALRDIDWLRSEQKFQLKVVS